MILLLLLALGIAACKFQPPSPSLPTKTALPTTRRPTSTPTITPTPTLMALSAASAPYLSPVASFGRGIAYSVTWSPDGKTLAVGSSLGIDLYDVETYELTGFLDTGGPVKTLAYNPDGLRLAAGLDGDIQLWEPASQSLLFTLETHTTPIRALAFTADGGRLFSGADGDASVLVWDVADGKLLTSYTESEMGIRSLAVSADGQLLLAATVKTVSVRSLATGELLYPAVSPKFTASFSVLAVLFGRDGQSFLAIGGEEKIPSMGSMMYERNLATGELLNTYAAGESILSATAVGPEQQWFLMGSNDGIRVWDAFTKKVMPPLKDPTGHVAALAFSPNGQKFAAIQYAAPTGGGTLAVWSFANQEIVHHFDAYTALVSDATFSPDGRWAALAGAGEQVRVWDMRDGVIVQQLDGFGPLALDPAGKVIAVNEGEEDGYSRFGLRLVESKEILPENAVFCFGDITSVFSSDGRRLLSGGGECPITLREIETGKVLAKLDEAPLLAGNGNHNLALSADEQWVAIWGDSTIEVWNLPEKTRSFLLERQYGFDGISLALSPDGRFLAVGRSSEDEQADVKVWEVASQRLLATLKTNLDEINALAFSPDGQLLALGGSLIKGETANLELWDAWAAEPIVRLEAGANDLIDVHFSTDGRHLLTVSDWGIIQVWDVQHAPAQAAALRPTLTPLPAGTATPTPLPVAVTQVAYYGKGVISSPYRSPDGNWIAYTQQGELHWVDAATFEEIGALPIVSIDPYYSSLLFSPNSQLLLAQLGYGAALVDLESHQVLFELIESVSRFAFAPDSRWMVYVQHGQTIKTWSADQREWGENAFTASEPEQTYYWNDLKISPDGRLVAAGASDGRVHLWDARRGDRRFVLEGHADVVASVAFSPDGRTLASGSDDGTVRLWNIQTGKLVRLITGFSNDITRVAFSDNGSQLQIGVGSQPDQVWEMASEVLQPAQQAAPTPDPFVREMLHRGYSTNQAAQMQFSPDGRTLALAAGHVSLFDVASQSVSQVLENPTGRNVIHLAFDAAGARLAAVDTDDNLFVWDTHTGELLTFQPISSQASAYAFSDNARYLAWADEQAVFIWDTFSATHLVSLPELADAALSSPLLSFSADGTLLYVEPHRTAPVQLWDWQATTLLDVYPLPMEDDFYSWVLRYPNVIRLKSDGWGSGGGNLELWDLETLTQLASTEYYDTLKIHFSPDGKLLAVLSGSDLLFWSTRTGEQLFQIDLWSIGWSFERYDWPTFAISEDNSTLAVTYNGEIQQWDIRPLAARLDEIDARLALSTAELPRIAHWPATATPASPMPDASSAITVTQLARFGDGQIAQVAWSADGQQILLGGMLGVYQHTAALTQTVFLPSDTPINSLVELPDGRILAAGNAAGQVRVWDAASGQILADLPESDYSQMALSPDGRLLVVYGDYPDEWITYDLATGLPVAQFQGNDRQPVFSPDGQFVALPQSYRGSTNYPDYVRVWDARRGVIVNALGGPDYAITDLTFSADGQYLAGAAGGSAWVWTTFSGALPVQFAIYPAEMGRHAETVYTQTVTSVALSPDNALLAIGDSEQNIWLYERASRRLLRRLTGHTNTIQSLRFSPDGTRLLSLDDSVLLVWEVAIGKLLAARHQLAGAADGLTFRSDGELIAWKGRTAWVLYPPDGALLHTTDIYTGTILSASPAGDWLAGYSPAGVSLWDAESGQYGRPLTDTTGIAQRTFTGAAFSPDGGRLAAFGSDGLWVYDLAAGDGQLLFEFDVTNPDDVTFSPDGRWLVTNVASDDGVVYPIVYNLETGESAWELPYSDDYASLAFSPDQRWLGRLSIMFGYYDSHADLELWDTTSYKIAHTIPFTDTRLTSLAFNPDSTLAAVGQENGRIALVDLTTFEIVTTFSAHDGSVEHLAFSPDGLYLASSSSDGTIRFWRVKLG